MQRVALAGATAGVVLLISGIVGGAVASSNTDKATAEFNETEVHRFVGHESETWRTRVYTRQGKFAGSGVVACVPTSSADSLQQCTGTYQLPRGRVAVQGLLTSRAGFNLVVVGGTDAYLGARGSMVVVQTQTTPRHSRLTFFFE